MEVVQRHGRRKSAVPLACLILSLSVAAQNDVPTFKAEAVSALIWDDANPSPVASTVHDPLTGNELHRLSYGGIEVSSRLGYERVSLTRADRLLMYVTTIANNSDSEVSITYGGAHVDGRIATPLQTVSSNKKLNQHNHEGAWDVNRMQCFKNGFASGELFFPDRKAPHSFAVPPGHSITVSFVTKDPRSTAILCSVDGCHLTGSVRYYISANHKDFVFVWAAHSAVYCGE